MSQPYSRRISPNDDAIMGSINCLGAIIVEENTTEIQQKHVALYSGGSQEWDLGSRIIYAPYYTPFYEGKRF